MIQRMFSSMRLRAGLAVVAIAGAATLLLRPSEPDAPVPPPPIAPAPAPAPLPAAPPPSPAAADTGGLRLQGVLGHSGRTGAAIFGLADGRQRLVRVGGEVVPGVRLESVGPTRATVHDGVRRLEFALPEAGQTEAVAPAPAPPQSPTPVADPRREVNDYRLALKPERNGEQVRGYRIAPGATLPLFQRAGLQPGDVILAVNGAAITDEERLVELPAELAAATAIEIDYERGGRRLKATVATGR